MFAELSGVHGLSNSVSAFFHPVDASSVVDLRDGKFHIWMDAHHERVLSTCRVPKPRLSHKLGLLSQ
jgi:hypothetical protein